jgi:Tol biopolymer transport system component
VFCTTRGSGTTSEYDVALYDADQGGFRSLKNLNSTYGQSEPCLSDDGGYVCFASGRPTGYGGSDVYIYSRQSQALIATPGLNTGANESWPRFTHDSVRLAFVRDSAGIRRIRLYEPYGDTLIALPGIDSPTPVDDDAPAPDLHGDRIAFQSNRSGQTHVYVWNRAGGIASAPGLVGDGDDMEPSLSANGRWLAFSSTRTGGAGGWDVYLYDLLSSAFVPLPRLNTAGDEQHPTVSADGRLLFFASRPDPAHNWSIWRYTLPDSNRSQPPNLADAAGDDRQPCVRWR